VKGICGALLSAVLALLPAFGSADWSSPQALSNSAFPSRTQYNFGWAIDVDGAGVAHAAWLEVTSPDPPGYTTGRVMYSRSADDGLSWSPPMPLSGAPQPFTGNPRVAASGPHVYVTWHGTHDGSGIPKIYLLHSHTQGFSWNPPRIVNTPAIAGAAWPSVNACGDAVHVVWSDSRSGVAEIYLRSSPDAGGNWTAVRQVSSPDGRSSWVPTVACWGEAVHVAWSDERHNVDEAGQPYDCGIARDNTACREEEYYRRSTDFGASWEPEVRLTLDSPVPRSSWAPSIAVWHDNVHVVFFDRRTDRFQVYYKRSTGGGAPHTWEPERMISADDGATDNARPVIAASGPDLHVVWFGTKPPLGINVLHAGSSDNGTSFGAPVTLTPRPSMGETHPSVAVSPRKSAHVIWYEADARGVDQIVHRALRTSLIVFSAMDAGNRFQIYSVKADGSDRKQLTRQGNNVTPAWTPDGERIIFASDRAGTRESYLMNEDGSGVSRIETSVVGNKLTPSMSHDRSRIAFAAENPHTGHPEIWVVKADGTGPRQLTVTPTANVGPTWSLFPRFSLDDSKILYASTQSGSSQIWIMNGDGTDKRRLTNGVATDAPDANAPNWSPDGRHIVFWAGFETQYGEIWTMDADGSNPKQLTDQPAPLSSDNPAWSPDGSKIIFDTNRSRSNVEIWIMEANGGNQRKLIGGLGAGGVMQMSWRPGLQGKGLPLNEGMEPTR